MRNLKKTSSFLLVVVMVLSIIPSAAFLAHAASFTPRLSAPARTGYYSNNTQTNPYSVNSDAGGGNCTWYAWGRAYEILGARPQINTIGNACTWYPNNQSSGAYPYGSTPKLGAIACWSGGSTGAGHVAVVEQINSDDTIVISESSWSATTWWFRTRTINKNGYYGGTLSFQGFIYIIDVDSPTSVPGIVPDLRTDKSVYSTTESIHFSWTAASGATEHWIYLWKDGSQLFAYNCGTGTSFTQAPSSPGSYTMYIRPGNSVGFNEGSPSCSFVVTPAPARPDSIWTDYPLYPAGATVPVSWSAAEGATSYHIEGWAKFPNGEDYCFINEDVGFVLSYEMGLSDAATYTIFVYAVNSSGRSEANSCTFTVRAITSTPDWFRTCTLDEHTYSVYLASMTWHEAQTWCQNHDGHLATITDTNEWKAVTLLTERFSEPHFFLGGTKESGAWQWVTNEAFSYTCWGQGQPDYDYETQMSLWNHNGEWNNVKFNEPLVYGFIFEKDPSAFSTKEKDIKPTISTTAYILNEGKVTVPDDSRIGTAPSDTISANRISGLKFSLLNCSGSINYSAHVSNIGWQSKVKDGALAGVSDYSEGIEAVKISLSGDVATKYSVYYHTFVFGKGWKPWAKDGEISGTIGGGFPITAIRVLLVPKATYCVHVSGQGWTANSVQGDTAGTTGQELGLEAIAIDLCDHAYGDVKYKTHMAIIGWGHSRYNGGYSGSTGLALQSEAFKTELLGTAASKFDILYRAHVADIGWLDWQRNANIAGTTGEDRQMEAIQVMVVPKNYQITDTPTYKTYEESIKRTIYFNANGGTCSTQSKAVIFGSTYGTLPTPTRENMAFVGWFTDTNVPVTSTTMCGLSGDLTVYAQWTAIGYTVTLDPDGGECGMPAVTAYYGESYGVLPTATRDGFTFDGWFASDGTLVTENTVCVTADDHTLTAHWTAVEVPVALMVKSDSTTVIDEARGLIYGLDFDLTETALREQYLDVADGLHMEIVSETGAIGTGAVVRLIDDATGDVVESFTIIIYGDLTGDGLLNTTDITVLRSINASMTEYPDDSPFLLAADVTHDGLVNTTDITALRSANATLSAISQTV